MTAATCSSTTGTTVQLPRHPASSARVRQGLSEDVPISAFQPSPPAWWSEPKSCMTT